LRFKFVGPDCGSTMWASGAKLDPEASAFLYGRFQAGDNA
jgi:hypothetical protein